MTSEKTYEVQIKQDGKWTIHETFEGHQKDEAQASAKTVFEEFGYIEAVKVVKEELDSETDTYNDSVVFRDAREEIVARKALLRKETADRATAPPTGGASAKKKDRKQKQKKGGRKRSFGLAGLTWRLIIGVVASLVFAAIGAALALEFLGGTVAFGIYFVGDAKLYLVIGVFAGSFLLSVAAVTFVLMRRVKVKARAKHPSSGSDDGKRHRPPPKPEISLFQVAAFIFIHPIQWCYRQLMIARSQEADRSAAAKSAPAPAAPAAPAAPDTEAKPEEAAEPESLSPTAQKLETYMMDFLNRALDGSRADKKTMDNFNRFGVSLFIAGACEILTTDGQLDEESHARVLAECVRVMGFKKSHAASLAQRYEEYLMADSRYMRMFQDGRKAIITYLADDTTAPASLDAALGEWNKPKTVEKQSGAVTVMFAAVVAPPVQADGVDADAVTPPAQADGVDADAARELADAHSRIVGEALNAHGGMEIKRTPRGIMASFAETSNGVEAAVRMHRKAALFNRTRSAPPLCLKIGINAGEPIAEEDDLYAKVVRLSAAIVDRAAADQILLSEGAARFCEGADFEFIDLGSLEPMAAGGEVGLVEVLWNDAPAAGDPEPPASTAPEGAASEEGPRPS